MYSEILLDILLAAVGIALSPFPVIAIMMILGSEHARSRGVAFAIGWLLGLSALILLTFFLLNNLNNFGNSDYPPTSWVRIIFGAILVALAAKKWLARAKPSQETTAPAWVATVDTLSNGKTVALGATLGGINPKNLAFSILFLTDLTQAALPLGQKMLLLLLYIFMSSLVVIVSVGYYLLATVTAAKRLQQIKTFMIVQNDAIMMFMFLFFGLLLIAKGLSLV